MSKKEVLDTIPRLKKKRGIVSNTLSLLFLFFYFFILLLLLLFIYFFFFVLRGIVFLSLWEG